MRILKKINMITALLLIVFIIMHGILGSFTLLGIGSHAGMLFAWGGLGLLAVHTVIGVILTVQTIRAEAGSGGKLYLKQNAAFWIKRLTGIAILCSLYFHFGMFSVEVNEEYVLIPFTTAKFIDMLVLVGSVFLHIFVNIRSLFVSMGIFTPKERRIDIMVFLSVILVFISVSLILYYISWCI